VRGTDDVRTVLNLRLTCRRFRSITDRNNQAIIRELVLSRWIALGAWEWLRELCQHPRNGTSFESSSGEERTMKKRQPSEMEIEAQALLDRLLLPEARDWIWMAKCLMQEVMENNLKMGVRSDTKASFSGLGFSKSTSFPEYFSIGTWKHGFLHGHAIRIYRGKHLYTGQWDKGRWEGEGTVLSVTPDTGGLYSGRYLQSMSHGFGVKKMAQRRFLQGRMEEQSNQWKGNLCVGDWRHIRRRMVQQRTFWLRRLRLA